MKQIELTSKFVLAIVGLASVSAILIPTYAVPSIKSADIVDGEVKTADLANDVVTSPKIKNGEVKTEDLASGAVKPNVQIVVGDGIVLSPGDTNTDRADCPVGTVVSGGGWFAPFDFEAHSNNPDDQNTWAVTGNNEGAQSGLLQAYAVCIGPSP